LERLCHITRHASINEQSHRSSQVSSLWRFKSLY